jgi:hypothetical protein
MIRLPDQLASPPATGGESSGSGPDRAKASAMRHGLVGAVCCSLSMQHLAASGTSSASRSEQCRASRDHAHQDTRRDRPATADCPERPSISTVVSWKNCETAVPTAFHRSCAGHGR